MRSRTRLALASLALLLIGTLLAGCGSSTLKIGWREFGGLSRKRATYVTFDGVQNKSFRVSAGKAIELTCDVTVEKGALAVALIAPSGERLWEETFREDGERFTTVTASEGGRYILRVEGQETGGGFDIAWDVKDQPS